MYIWVGIDMDNQLEEIREAAKAAERAIGFRHSNFTLPLHVSLKISFPVSNELASAVMADVLEIYKSVSPFLIPVSGLQNEGTIAWIRMGESKELNALHDALNEMLLSRYGVPLHEYDTDYKFHTTLFMDEDSDKVARGYAAVKNTPLPNRLRVERLLIGTSNSGALGSYQVEREFSV